MRYGTYYSATLGTVRKNWEGLEGTVDSANCCHSKTYFQKERANITEMHCLLRRLHWGWLHHAVKMQTHLPQCLHFGMAQGRKDMSVVQDWNPLILAATLITLRISHITQSIDAYLDEVDQHDKDQYSHEDIKQPVSCIFDSSELVVGRAMQRVLCLAQDFKARGWERHYSYPIANSIHFIIITVFHSYCRNVGKKAGRHLDWPLCFLMSDAHSSHWSHTSYRCFWHRLCSGRHPSTRSGCWQHTTRTCCILPYSMPFAWSVSWCLILKSRPRVGS